MLKNRKFFTVLALVLTLTMAFTMTALADGSATVNVSNGATAGATLNWPSEACVVTVSGLTSGDKVSIVVYDSDLDVAYLTASDILYIGQVTADAEGTATITCLLKDGNYAGYDTVMGGTDSIAVAVGNNGADTTVRYTAITLLFKDEITSVAATPSVNVVEIDDGRPELTGTLTVTYAGGGTGSIDLTNTDLVAVSGYNTGVANPDLSVTPSLTPINSLDPVEGDPFELSVVTDKTDYDTVLFKAVSGDATNLHVKGVDDGANLVLPALPSYTKVAGYDETYQCIGWSDGTSLYPAGATVAITGDKTFYGVWTNLAMEAGCSIRTKAKTGLRWTTTMDSDLYDAIVALVGANKVSVGAVVCPNSYLSKEGLADDEEHFTMVTMDGATGLAGKETKYAKIVSQSHVTSGLVDSFNVVLANLSNPNGIVRVNSGRSFLEITYANNTSAVFYAAYRTADHTRSAKNVAISAQNDATYYNGLNADEKAVIDEFASASK